MEGVLFMAQHQIKEKHPLLDSNGRLIEAGYATQPLLSYDRSGIKASKFKIKEWDYYLVACDDFAVALTIADNSYMGLDSISLIDFRAPWQHTNSPMSLFTMGKRKLPSSSSIGDVAVSKRNYQIKFEHKDDYRLLTFRMDNFKDKKPIEGVIRLENTDSESMVIATPFAENPTAFYYNQKINCLPATGSVQFGGRTYEFKKGESFGVLDWGRGVWPYKNTWYWGSGSGKLNGVPFGFNIGYGFGDTSAATENMIFYGNKAHKLGEVKFNIPMKNKIYTTRGGCCGASGVKACTTELIEDYMEPWTFTSDDGRFEMDFVPIIDRAAFTDAKILSSDQHQVFGRFSGKAVLDDGTVLTVSDMLGFAEKVYNKW